VSDILLQGKNIGNREQFIKAGLLTKTLFINAAGFLRISQKEDLNPPLKLQAEHEHAPDPLDDTRIHPENYELARKMALDALEYDEEETHGKHPSWVVGLIMEDPENEKKLTELSLEEFAVSLYSKNGDLKRQTLNAIRDELMRPFSDQRKPYPGLEGWDVLTMLSGETRKSLADGLVVTVGVTRVQRGCISVRLQSGVEGIVADGFVSEKLQKGQTMTCAIVDVKTDIEGDRFLVTLSNLPAAITKEGREAIPQDSPQFWDKERCAKAADMMERRKRAETSRRVINHPNFHNFDTTQAEAYLATQQRGDVVIRPSSRGIDHLAVTWKVDEELYQHIGKFVFSDLEFLKIKVMFVRRCG
jgi:transcription elongation factor SPT6